MALFTSYLMPDSLKQDLCLYVNVSCMTEIAESYQWVPIITLAKLPI